jgi:hypothetical protein
VGEREVEGEGEGERGTEREIALLIATAKSFVAVESIHL